MKKYLFFALAATAAIFFTACKKEQTIGFTVEATSEQTTDKDGDKLTYGNNQLRWQEGDSIRIFDESLSSSYFANYVLSQGAGGASGMFDYSSGTSLSSGPYVAIYPGNFAINGPASINLPAVQRSVNGNLCKLPMFAKSSNDKFRFYHLCGVVRLRLSAATDAKVTTIAICADSSVNGRFYINGTPESPTLTRNNLNDNNRATVLALSQPQTIRTQHDFYIYLPAGEYNSFKILVTADGKECLKQATSTIRIERAQITTITLSNLSFIDVGKLPGYFTYGRDEISTELFYFSKGNLQYIGSAATPYWKFADHQYDYIHYANYENKDSSNYDIEHFCWGSGPYYVGMCQGSSINYLNPNYPGFTYGLWGVYANNDWGVAHAISNGGNVGGLWRTPNQFDILFSGRKTSTVNGTNNAHYVLAIVNGTKGVVIFPDIYIHPDGVALPRNINKKNGTPSNNNYSATDWAAMEASGAVFLPFAGDRVLESAWNMVNTWRWRWEGHENNGRYWLNSLTYDNGDRVPRCCIISIGDLREAGTNINYTYAYTVRLIRYGTNI